MQGRVEDISDHNGGSLSRELDELEERVANVSSILVKVSNKTAAKEQWTCTKVTIVFIITVLVLLMCSYVSWRWMMAFQEAMSKTFKPL